MKLCVRMFQSYIYSTIMQIVKCIKSLAVIANDVNTTFLMIELRIISFKLCQAKFVKHFFNNFKFKYQTKNILAFHGSTFKICCLGQSVDYIYKMIVPLTIFVCMC